MAQVQPKEQFFLDNVQEQGFLVYLKSLGEKSDTIVRMFDRGEYYTVHGQDAIMAAKEIFRTNSVIKMLGHGDRKIESVVLSKLNFESFCRDLLLVRQYRVEVYKQRGKYDWEIEYKASPGNLTQFEEILFNSNNEVPVDAGVLAVKISVEGVKKIVGISYIDVGNSSIFVAEFEDGDSFSHLESVVVQLGAKECIIPSGDTSPEGIKLKKILSRHNLLLTERKKAEFSSKDVAQDLNRLLSNDDDEDSQELNQSTLCLPQLEMSVAMASLEANIKYLELLSDDSKHKYFTLKTFEIGQFVYLDRAALSALHISGSGGGSERGLSLNSLLDKGCTLPGKRLMAQWLRQPLIDIKKIVERQDLVEILVTSPEIRHDLSDNHLRRIPDLNRLARKFARKNANLQDCYKLFQCIKKLPMLIDCLKGYDGKNYGVFKNKFVEPLEEMHCDLSKYLDMIDMTLDMDRVDKGEFVIKPGFDEFLNELREKMDVLQEDIEKQLKRAANDLNLDAGKGIKLESNSQNGYFFRVTLKDEKCLRNNRSYQTIDTNKSGVRFTNVALKDLNEQFVDLKCQYEKQQKSVADEIIAIAAGYVEVIHNLSDTLATLDCILSLSVVAVSAPIAYVRPKLLAKGSGIMWLKECRHPCLEQQDAISYIPNDCRMDRDNGIFHIITGPNMGGKSTFMRSVGVSVLLAHMGAFVPCSEAQISIVDSVLARVGAGDCQMKGVSTFMTEMLETSAILRTATKDSLIIIDELGRGTSTYDGFGLASAISEYISKEIGSFCLFATHFHELTDLENVVDNVKNYHVTATTASGSLTLLYQVQRGACDRSFGIHVAKLANFPEEVIEYAKRQASELEDDFGDADESQEDVKKRKIEKCEGESIIDEYLAKADALDLSSMSDSDIEEAIYKMRVQLIEKNNPYVMHLLKV